MFTDANSIEIDDKIKLPPSETLNQLYNLNRNRKGIRILTVAVYVLSVSLTAIILSIYYLFVWDPNEMKTFTHPPIALCDKIIIPELIAIKLLNSSREISAEEFYQKILYHHRQNLIEEQNKQKLKLWQLEQKQLQVNIMLHQQKFMNYSNFHKSILMHHHQQLMNNHFKNNRYITPAKTDIPPQLDGGQINQNSDENSFSNINNSFRSYEPVNQSHLANPQLASHSKYITSSTESIWQTIMPQLQTEILDKGKSFAFLNDMNDSRSNDYAKVNADVAKDFGSSESNSDANTSCKHNCEAFNSSSGSSSISRVIRSKLMTNRNSSTQVKPVKIENRKLNQKNRRESLNRHFEKHRTKNINIRSKKEDTDRAIFKQIDNRPSHKHKWRNLVKNFNQNFFNNNKKNLNKINPIVPTIKSENSFDISDDEDYNADNNGNSNGSGDFAANKYSTNSDENIMLNIR